MNNIFTKTYEGIKNKLPVLRKPSVNSAYDDLIIHGFLVIVINQVELVGEHITKRVEMYGYGVVLMYILMKFVT